MTEAERERILDRRIQRRLATDKAYIWAEDAEAQALREAEIEREEDAKLPEATSRRSMQCDICGAVFYDGIEAGNHEMERGHRVSWAS